MKYEWYEQDGHIFSKETKLKNNKDFRNGENFEVETAIAFNVGTSVARHIVKLHNDDLYVKTNM